MPGQKWNYVALTYSDNRVDIFINGNLEKTYIFTNDAIPTYTGMDRITVGDGDGTVSGGGLYGAICNVNYYKTPLTQIQIVSAYNMLMHKNPPR